MATMDKQKHINKFIYSNKTVLIVGFGLAATISLAVAVNYIRSTTYPELSSLDSLHDLVASVNTDRGRAFVEFSGGRKCEIPWAKNFEYKDFTSLSSIISPGDLISKEAFSDTVILNHDGKEYIYVLRQTLGQ